MTTELFVHLFLNISGKEIEDYNYLFTIELIKSGFMYDGFNAIDDNSEFSDLSFCNLWYFCVFRGDPPKVRSAACK